MSSIADIVRKVTTDGVNPNPRSLASYVEATKHIKLDPWQHHLCRQLEEAFWLAQFNRLEDKFIRINFGEGKPYQIAPSGLRIDQERIDNERGKGVQIAIHAPPQFGKSIIISQCYPAWILGWDPLHRFRLATYSMLHSARFSVVVKYLMMSPEHQALFPDPMGHLPLRRSKVAEWSTNARLLHPDGQPSFSGLGLLSGLVGTGFETLLMDDPYKSAEDALSEIIRDKTWRFFTDTAAPRAMEHSNVLSMFHRYHQDDMGGRAIATGQFKLLRYAAEADGDYEDEESGLVFPDPIGRKEGEYLSPVRFSPGYYLRKKVNEQVWFSQFQGRPSAKTGKMFNVGLLKEINRCDAPPMLHWVRSWDNAATDGGGAYTAGPKMAVDAAENIYIWDMKREQVGTAERQALQEATANEDGKLVQIHVPQDPGSAGKDVAFEFEQEMSNLGFLVTATKVTGTKEARAHPFSKAVNSSKAFLVKNADSSVPAWHKPLKSELRYFPASTYKDQVDALADGYSHLMRLFYRGLVIKGYSTENFVHRSLFVKRFNTDKIPAHWEVAAAVRVGSDASRPSGYTIAARAAEDAQLGETIFIAAAVRMYVNNPIQLFDALRLDLNRLCAKGIDHPHITWLNKGASDVLQVTAHKMDMRLTEFDDDATAGIPETNYYFQQIPGFSPFYNRAGATRCYAIVDDDQYEKESIRDDGGMLSLRQDLQTWSYTDKGEVQPFAGITLDCIRMAMYKFSLSATELTIEQRRISKLAPELQPDAVRAKLGTPQFIEAVWAQEHALATIRAQEEDEKRESYRASTRRDHNIGPRAVMRRYRRG